MGTTSINVREAAIDHDVLHKWQELLDLLTRIVQIPAALIMRVEPASIKVCVSSRSDGNPYEEDEAAPLGSGLYCETVLATRAHLIVPDALADPRWRDNPDVKLGMVSYMGLPLTWPDQHLFGTICVLDGRENPYSPVFLQLLQQFRGIVERDLQMIDAAHLRAREDAAVRADEAERVRRELQQLRGGEQQALALLRESERRWHFALEGAGDGVWDWDIGAGSVFYSARCLELFGFAGADGHVAFSDWRDHVHPDDLAALSEAIEAHLDGGGGQFTNEHRFRVGDDWKWLLTRGMVVGRDGAGQALRMIGTYSDVTARKLAEFELLTLNNRLEERVAARTAELQQAMEQIMVTEKMASLGRLVAGVAHELNTPLGNIVLSSSTLKEAIDGVDRLAAGKRLTYAALQEFLGHGKTACELIERNGLHAGELIMSFKQVAVDQASQQRRLFDLRKTVQDMAAALGPITRRARVTLEVRIPAGIGMDSYPGSMDQIITNLVTNSINHGFEGRDGGRITISASARHDRVELVYRDDGRGIEKALQGKVFEPFYTTKMGQGGSGLGLSIVHNIVQAIFKGSVRLESEPGHGVCFVFSLPRRLADAAPGHANG
ncbi:GAF domain-containing sensor histidine kinase [Janthinobacterium sp. CG_S6]|uniref:GAF domain-containing sensor histidine kinase n=1 Tax=Janthinobacterium sp. CG_S6 TaxID=3071707 RepID=UPI002E06076C|nr:signal transduction histidine kinase [Janthinobacterium sp. CG_S6]